jgi:hypothetical protein
MGNQHVIGCHIDNIIIHILASGFLSLFLLSVLKMPRSTWRYERDKSNIAILASVHQ